MMLLEIDALCQEAFEIAASKTLLCVCSTQLLEASVNKISRTIKQFNPQVTPPPPPPPHQAPLLLLMADYI